jgi:hypothetical protein
MKIKTNFLANLLKMKWFKEFSEKHKSNLQLCLACVLFVLQPSSSMAMGWDELNTFYTPLNHSIYEGYNIDEDKSPALKDFEDSINRIKTWYCYKGYIVAISRDDYYFIFNEKTEKYTKFSNQKAWNQALKKRGLIPNLWTRWWTIEDAQEKMQSLYLFAIFIFLGVIYITLGIPVIGFVAWIIYLIHWADKKEDFKLTGNATITLFTMLVLLELVLTAFITTTFIGLAFFIIFIALIITSWIYEKIPTAQVMTYGVIPSIMLISLMCRVGIGVNSI